jgi:subtilisin family serine protease
MKPGRVPRELPVVVVYDGGVDQTHPDLDEAMWTNPGEIPGDHLDNDGNGVIDDVHGFDALRNMGGVLGTETFHGTHVAGIIAAEDNGEGVTGVAAGRAQIMSIHAAMRASREVDAFESAVDYVVMMKQERGVDIRVFNASIGMHNTAPEVAARFEAGVRRLLDADILFVVATANDHGRNMDEHPFYPANVDLPNVITVAAMNATNDRLARSSGMGPRTVELAAPGVNILSTVPFAGYSRKSGTSMAAPHVSGVAARLFFEHPELTAEEARAIILASVEPDPDLEGKVSTGGKLRLPVA